jgi:collagen type III alpha
MRFALVFIAYVSLSVAPALAQDWRAVEVTGAVRVMTPGQAARTVAAQDVLPVGAIVTTGRDGRAVFSNGAARATLSANSRLTLAPSEQGFTRFVQDLGAVLFQVDRQRDPHFEVRTSLVAAVVKGTTFTVSVEPDEHRVFVAEGTVEVSALDGGDTELVTGGGIAEVERDAPDRVERPEPASEHSAAPPAALDYASLTGGLIRNRDSEAEDVPAEPTELVLADASGSDTADTAADDNHGAPAGDDDDGDGADTGDDVDDGAGDDDGDNGHGNDDDGDDGSNPGNGGDDDDAGTGDDADDGNNGHGNDDDGDDGSNPGNGGDDDDAGTGDDDDDGNNGHGNDDDGDDGGNPGNGGDDDDDDGNNGNGNDDDGDDDSNPGNGHGHGHDDDDDDDDDDGDD